MTIAIRNFELTVRPETRSIEQQVGNTPLRESCFGGRLQELDGMVATISLYLNALLVMYRLLKSTI